MLSANPSGQIRDRLMRQLTTFILLTFLLSCNRTDYSDKKVKKQKPLTNYPGEYIDTEYKYTDSTGLVVIIQNSVPKGGSYNPTGKNFESRIFWNRVINETDTPLELTINFPADSFAIRSSPDAYLKVFLPSDTMTIDKETSYSYGVLGTDLFNLTMLQRTINPKDACLFYIGAFFTEARGAARAELVLKEQDLFYRIRGIAPELDSALIPCGQIVFY